MAMSETEKETKKRVERENRDTQICLYIYDDVHFFF